jgi:peptidylprolyl isomerase
MTKSRAAIGAILLSTLSFASACANKKQPSGDTQSSVSAAATPTPTASAAPATSAAAAPPARPERPEIKAPTDVAAAPANAEKSKTGLASIVLTKGTGTEKPGPTDKVFVKYTGWMKDGTMFDTTEGAPRPISFPLNRVIKGWTEGLQLMVKGEKRRFWIPADLAYGEVARRPGGPSGQLTFDVELVDFTASPKVPEDVAAPPASATKTKSGLAYRVLKEGTGTAPTAKSKVTVHYSGWTKDGNMFDSSVPRGEPTSFGLDQVIKGWTEGVQLMKPGAKYRFWIPGDLAYGEKPQRPGMPYGQLTFDIELLKVE